MSSPHASRGGMSSRDSHGIVTDSTATTSTGNEGLVKSDGLYRTFTPSNAGWNLQDFAWDKQAHRVASREDIAAAQRDRREREPGNAVPVTDPGSAGRTLDAPRPVRPLAPATLAKARLAGRGGLGGQSTRKAAPSPPREAGWLSPALAVRGASSDGTSKGSIGSVEEGTEAGKKLKPGQRTRGAERSQSARASKKKSSSSKVAETDADATDHALFSRRCAATPCESMCQPSSQRRVERVLCVEHAAMRDVQVANETHRFCQVCYALHPTSAFKSTNRTCNAVLLRKRLLRIQRQKKRVGAAHVEEGEDKSAEAEEAAEVLAAAVPARRKSGKETATKPAKAAAAGAEGRGARARPPSHQAKAKGARPPSHQAKAKRTTASYRMTTAAPMALNLLEADDAGATAQTEEAETSKGAATWLLSSLGLAHGPAPAAKRARGISPPVGVAEEIARNQMILDMEHGALGSAQITSAAIKIPYASPAYLSSAAGGAAGGSSDALVLPGHGVEHEMNALLQWMDQAPVRAPTHRGESYPAEDFGTDPFIRPGSLIYGVHSQGVVTDSVSAEAANLADADEPVSARTRHSSRSMLRALASPEKGSGRLLRNAAAALREKALPDAAGDVDAKGAFHASKSSLDASDDGLLRIPEGVFGSFNGEICRLDVDPETGETTATRVKNTPYGFPEGALAGWASMLDSAAPRATLTLPFAPAPGTQMVCMFQGAHLPLLVEPRGDGTTDVTVRFHPEGGYHAAAEWALDGDDFDAARDAGAEHGVGGDGVVSECSYERRAALQRAPPLLEGTASLEMLIAEGPMRGLPVGRVLPLLLSPDAELRREVASAMRSLEQANAHREEEVERAAHPAGSALGVLPEPAALVSMLGAVLHAVGRNQEPNPRMHRGALAMAHYFSLKRLGARLGEDVRARHRIISSADLTALMRASVRAAVAPHLAATLAALVAAVCVAVYAKRSAWVAADDVDLWVGIGASAAAVAISAGLVALLAMAAGPPERQRAL